MRLRLRIQRNELPTVSVVWPVGADGSRQTVAQFLSRINERVPLEGNSWGLEDYAVLIGGFEVFHYDEIASVCKDEDEVLIRPLTYVEVRARTLAGRAQITADGRRLVDGVPFGRPLLKRPSRPDVTIPAPKRQKLELDESERLQDDGDEDDDESDDEDFEMDNEDEESDSDDQSEESEEEQDEGGGQAKASDGKLARVERGDEELRLRPRRTQGRIHSSNSHEPGPTRTTDRKRRKPSVEATASDTDSSGNSSATSSSDAQSDSDDDSDSDTSSDTSSEDSDASSTSSESEQGNRAITLPHDTRAATKKSLVVAGLSNKQPNTSSLGTGGLPFQGKAVTQARNRRRTDSKRLAVLKRLNKLPPTATIKDMRELFPAGAQKDEASVSALHDSSPAQPSKSSVGKANELALELELRRQKLLADIASGGIDVSTISDSPSHRKKAKTPDDDTSKDSDAGLDTNANQVQDFTPPAPTRRSRLDVASTNRLVFGSLGLRTPKTAEERKQLQEKLEQSTKRPVVERAMPTPPSNSEPDQPLVEDEDAWRDKIVLSAVECCDENVVLSAPPFPFEQRWDPQYRTKKKRKSNMFSESKKKRKTQNEQYVETYDKYNTDGNGDALNYDDDEEVSELDEYWEEGALLDGERGYADDQDAASLQLVTETALEQAKDDFPDLPADPSILPLLGEADASEGDFVVFNELACSASTAWQPRMVTRTVQLQHKDGSEWTVLLAPRDLPPKKYDDEGNRVYEKFETMDEEDGQDGEPSRVLQWGDMSEPRLLLRHADMQA